MNKLKELAEKKVCFVDEIPLEYQNDFNIFIVGKGLSTIDNRVVTYDIEEFYNLIQSQTMTEQEFDLVITFTIEPNEKQLEMAKDFVKGFELSNPNLKGAIVIPRPPRG